MNTIDLSKLPAPQVVEELSFEAILAAMKTDLEGRCPEWDATVKSDPACKALEVAAYRETLLRQRVNDAARAVMLAYAAKADLDHLAALQEVERLVVDPGDPDAVPPVAPTHEDDDDLRHRVQLAPESRSTAGPELAYKALALGADGAVKDVDVTSPADGEVQLTVLSRVGNGTADSALLDKVAAACSDKKVRPLTDKVSVVAATIEAYSIDAVLHLYPGTGADIVLQEAIAAAREYAGNQHVVGGEVSESGLHAALHRSGVKKVILSSAIPAAGAGKAPHCTAFNITTEVAA